MAEEHRPGFYKDKFGNWRKDRRGGVDRRKAKGDDASEHERRKLYRRRIDRERFDESREMIEEALDDFAAEHGGRV